MAASRGSLTCPRCSGMMECGYLVDKGNDSSTVPKWVAGEPQKSIWFGLKLRGKAKLDVLTYRCRRCGYLESYAPS